MEEYGARGPGAAVWDDGDVGGDTIGGESKLESTSNGSGEGGICGGNGISAWGLCAICGWARVGITRRMLTGVCWRGLVPVCAEDIGCRDCGQRGGYRKNEVEEGRARGRSMCSCCRLRNSLIICFVLRGVPSSPPHVWVKV
jgi:hypothetical protein